MSIQDVRDHLFRARANITSALAWLEPREVTEIERTKERIELITIYLQIRKLSTDDKEYKPCMEAIRKELLKELGIKEE